MSEQMKTQYAYFHDCPALGPHVKLPRALVADASGEYVLYFQHKCPFCSQVSGDREYAKGVTVNPIGGYDIDTSIAEKLTSAGDAS